MEIWEKGKVKVKGRIEGGEREIWIENMGNGMVVGEGKTGKGNRKKVTIGMRNWEWRKW